MLQNLPYISKHSSFYDNINRYNFDLKQYCQKHSDCIFANCKNAINHTSAIAAEDAKIQIKRKCDFQNYEHYSLVNGPRLLGGENLSHLEMHVNYLPK